MADIAKIIYTQIADISKINSIELSSIQSVLGMGFGGGPPEGQWVQHFAGSNGFSCLANCSWDGDSFNWSGPGLVIQTPFDAIWQTNYRPLLCRVTYGNGQDSNSYLKDQTGGGGHTICQFYAASGAGSAEMIMDFSDGSMDITRWNMYGADIITNIEFYEPVWIERTNNTFWESGDFTWDGSLWDLDNDGEGIISVKSGSTWHINYRPDYIYISGSYFDDVELRDEDNNVIASKSPAASNTGGPWQMQINWSNNKDIKDIRTTGGFGGEYINNISFCFVS
jgi:hypothetical protein